MTTHHSRGFVVAGLLAVFLVTASVAKDEETAERKAQPFVSYGCYQCHGYVGQGGNSGPRLLQEMPLEAFEKIVRFPYGVMPAYPRELLGEDDLRSIYSYIQNLPRPRELKDLPLLYDTSPRAPSGGKPR